MIRRSLLAAAAGLSLAAFPGASHAQDSEPSACRQLLELSWSDIVRSPVPRPGGSGPPSIVVPPPSIPPSPSLSTAAAGEYPVDPSSEPDREQIEDPGSEVLAIIARACRDEREPYLNISLLHAERQAQMGNVDEAIELLERVQPQPEDRVFSAYYAQWLKLRWAQVMQQVMQAQRLRAYQVPAEDGSYAEYISARGAVLDLHHQRLLDLGLAAEEPAEIAGVQLRGYRVPDDAPGEVALPEGQPRGWMLIAALPNGAIQNIAAMPSRWSREGEDPRLDMSIIQCSSSGGGIDEGDVRFDGALDYAKVLTVLEQHLTRDPDEDDRRGMSARPGMPDFCPNFSEILPGFGAEYAFIGTEYRDPDAAISESDLMLSLQSDDPETRAWASDYLLDHPDLVEPINLIFAVLSLIERGDMEQATFWYYIWQTRTRPWMTAEGGQAQVRGALAATVGPTVNEWAASDIDALKQLYVRAIRYELAFPLYEGRPDGVSRREWRDLIAGARAENSEENILQLFENTENMQRQRQENGLYNGPWLTPGRPLKDEWIID